MTKDEKKELVYDLMTGALNLEEYPVEMSRLVENEFEDEKECEEAYREIYEAKQCICERLGEEEDKDLEKIMDNWLAITRHLCMRMYDYGESKKI